MERCYPIVLNWAGLPVLIVGGGHIAAQKVETLAPSGAEIVLVALRVSDALRTLGESGKLHIHPRAYEPGDVRGKALIYAATDDAALNHRVVADARAAGVLANAVDDPAHCDFYTPSILRRGAFTLALSSSGRFPGLSRALRETLEEWLPEEDEALFEALFEVRRQLKKRPPRERTEALRSLIARFRSDYLQPGPAGAA